MTKERIAVIFGGPSPEHEVSIASARTVLSHLNPAHFDIVPIYMSRRGALIYPLIEFEEESYIEEIEDFINGLTVNSSSDRNVWSESPSQYPNSEYILPPPALARLKLMNLSLVFILVHGYGGEDGQMQRALESAGIPYLGSDAKSSDLCMDKRRSLDAIAAAGIIVPQGCAFRCEGGLWRSVKQPERALSLEQIAGEVRFLPPWVVKPNCGGSSVGVTIVTDAANLEQALVEAAKLDDLVLVETYISGTEVTCGILERRNEQTGQIEKIALPPTQIIPRHSNFFDYESKYTEGETMEITPANIDQNVIEKIQDTSLRVHRTLGCRGLSRTDIIVQDGEPFVLEVNTLPGMTPTSLFPQGAAAIGIDFAPLMEEMIHTALGQTRSTGMPQTAAAEVG